MQGDELKANLLRIAGQINEKTQLEDIYLQLALLEDIDDSEADESKGHTLTHQEVAEQSKAWLK
ncbi:MAG TPA: hypothetical protein VGK59_19975 [Ohtaekwangia sp.]